MARLDAIEAAGKARSFGRMPLLAFSEHPDLGGLALSEAQRAVMQAAQPESVSVSADLCRKLFKCGPEALPQRRPRAVVVSGGGRSGKTSRLLAPACVHAAWTVPVRAHGAPPIPGFPDAQIMAAGERPRAIVISSKKKLAAKTFQMIRGIIEASPILRRAVVGEITTTCINLLRPDGIVVEIMIGVASEGGADARSASLVFFGLDEAAFLRGEGYAANDEDLYSAGSVRVVPYGQTWIVTTPWVEGEGLVERLIATSWGSHADALVAARVSTRTFNPTWDPSGEIEAAERKRPGGEENVQREVHGLPLARGTKGLFPPAAVRRALERRSPGGSPEALGAGADIAHDSDHASLAHAARWPGGLFGLTKILSDDPADERPPSEVYARYADACADAEIRDVAADSHYKWTFKEALKKRGVRLVDAPAGRDGKATTYLALRSLLTEDRLALGDLPADVRDDLAEQLAGVLRKPGEAGSTIIVQRRLADGNHCDDVSSSVLALWRVGSCDPKLWRERATTHSSERRPTPPGSRPARDEWRAGGSARDEWR